MKILKLYFFLGCFLTSTWAFSVETRELSSFLNNIKTMQADFIQKIYDNHGSVVQTSLGRMALERPGKFRWQVVKPIPQLIIAKDNKLWIYDADLEQVTIRLLSKSQSETPALLLSHVDKQLENKFIFKSLATNEINWHWYELKPKQADSMFEWIKMGFYNNQIKEMRLQDHLGHATVITFNHIQINKAISASLFNLKIPANVDVINETGTS